MAVTYRRASGGALQNPAYRLADIYERGAWRKTPGPSPVFGGRIHGSPEHHPIMIVRTATSADIPELALLNAALIRDEGHRNTMTVPQLEARMRKFLDQGHVAALFGDDGRTAGYALWRVDDDGIYLRQFFIARRCTFSAGRCLARRRRAGICRTRPSSSAVNPQHGRCWPRRPRHRAARWTGHRRRDVSMIAPLSSERLAAVEHAAPECGRADCSPSPPRGCQNPRARVASHRHAVNVQRDLDAVA